MSSNKYLDHSMTFCTEPNLMKLLRKQNANQIKGKRTDYNRQVLKPYAMRNNRFTFFQHTDTGVCSVCN